MSSVLVVRAWAGLCLLAGAATASPALAQTPTSNATPVRLPTDEERGLRLDLLADVQYDSNIFRTDDRLIRPVRDEIVIVDATARYAQVLGATTVHGLADVAYNRYVSNGERSRPRFDLGADAETPLLGRCVVKPAARFTSQRSDFGDINAAVENVQQVTVARVAADCARPAGWYPLTEFGVRVTRNDPLFRFADETAYSGKGGIGYKRPSLGEATVYYRFTSAHRPALDFTTKIDQAGVTFHRAVVSGVAVELDLNYLHAHSVGLASRAYSGPGYTAAVLVRPLPRLSVRGSAERVIVNDSLVPAAFTIQSDYLLRGDYQLSSYTRFWASGQIGNRGFRDTPGILMSPFATDQFREAVVGGERRIGRRLSAHVEGRYFVRRTQTGVNQYDVTLITGGLRYRL